MCNSRKIENKEAVRWSENPFQFKLSDEYVAIRKAKRVDRMCVPCSECGSAKVLGAASQRKYIKTGRIFCDEDCASMWKSRYYRTKDHQEKPKWYYENIRQRSSLRLAAKRLEQRHKNTRSCGWCWGTFTGRAMFCSENCQYQSYLAKCFTIRISREDWSDAKCKHCGNSIPKVKSRKPNGFCSNRCAKRSVKRNREHRIRSCSGKRVMIHLGVLAERTSWCCSHCGIKTHKPDGHARQSEATVDHIVPLAKGGKHDWLNVQLLCRRCNTIKRDKLPEVKQMLLFDGCVGHKNKRGAGLKLKLAASDRSNSRVRISGSDSF